LNILADATLPDVATLFKTPFKLTWYDQDDHVPALIADQTILLCRSTLKVTADLLKNTAIQCVATASSGTDHIDTDYLRSHGIALIDAKGSNAQAVTDYVIASAAYLQQQGYLHGMRAGVVGAGEVGSRVAHRLKTVGFDVVVFDPLKAQHDSQFISCAFEALTQCHLVCVHANLHETSPYPSKNLFDLQALQQLRPDVCLINASRGGIVNENALLALRQPIVYCTDVYCNEPNIEPRIVDYATLCTPHIAGHSIEAKQYAVIQVSEQLHRHYGLVMPVHSKQRRDSTDFDRMLNANWQHTVLGYYNPCVETQLLKSAQDKRQAFLLQRQAHQFRHDFSI